MSYKLQLQLASRIRTIRPDQFIFHLWPYNNVPKFHLKITILFPSRCLTWSRSTRILYHILCTFFATILTWLTWPCKQHEDIREDEVQLHKLSTFALIGGEEHALTFLSLGKQRKIPTNQEAGWKPNDNANLMHLLSWQKILYDKKNVEIEEDLQETKHYIFRNRLQCLRLDKERKLIRV